MNRKPGSAYAELITEIRKISQSQGLNTVFTTFLELMATSLSVQMDPFSASQREKRYEDMVSGLTREVVSAYARMCALMYLAVKEHEDDPRDILGAIYHELRLNNEWNGQYFTPDDICRMMAMLLNPVDEDTVKRNGYITINEPTCGSGTMVIGAIWAMKQSSFDYRSKSFFVAQDIDIRCVWMAYIQLCLYQIPAVVIHGNTLTLEEWSRWYTPYAFSVLSNTAEKEATG